MKRLRFSLFGLLLLFTVAAACLGYAQWRRRFVVEQCGAMARLGTRIYLDDSWWWRTVTAVEVKNTPPELVEIEERASSVGANVTQLLGGVILYPDEMPSGKSGGGKVMRGSRGNWK